MQENHYAGGQISKMTESKAIVEGSRISLAGGSKDWNRMFAEQPTSETIRNFNGYCLSVFENILQQDLKSTRTRRVYENGGLVAIVADSFT